MNSLSIVLPTLNCADTIHGHVKSMEQWLDLADEIIAVDSDSEDGTAEIIRENIHHPGLRVINHPRGLYQSWNHAISQTTGKWIYISTIGDSITRDQLEHLLETGEAMRADVVVSAPEFVFDAHIRMETPVWPVHHILNFHGIQRPFAINPLAAFVHAARYSPYAILGSSASNLYRGDHLRARPFPTCFRMAGDTGWGIHHALETRFCYSPQVGSIFRFHSDTYSSPDLEANKLLIQSLYKEVIQIIQEDKTPENQRVFDILEITLNRKESYLQARADLGLARSESAIPWYLRPSALNKRRRRDVLKKQMLSALAGLETELRKLPLETLP